MGKYNFYNTIDPQERPLRNVCPICGDVCRKIVKNFSDIIGCDKCLDIVDADYFFDEEG